MSPVSQRSNGFTLLEILLVVAALAILAGIVVFAINPGKQIAETRNSQRKVDVNTILNAVYQYSIDNGGLPPALLSQPAGTAGEICKTGASDCAGMIDLTVLTASERYLISLPVDPQAAAGNSTEYEISRTQFNRVKVAAPNAENAATIEATR